MENIEKLNIPIRKIRKHKIYIKFSKTQPKPSQNTGSNFLLILGLKAALLAGIYSSEQSSLLVDLNLITLENQAIAEYTKCM